MKLKLVLKFLILVWLETDLFGRETIGTNVVFSQDIQQIESINHMSWLPIEKLTTEEKDIIQDFNKKKTTLHGKYHQQIRLRYNSWDLDWKL